MPILSVVLPTYNRLERLKMVLAGLEQQTFPLSEFEVLVVSDGSTDGTEAYLQTYAASFALRGLTQENQGPAVARNLGVAKASGDIVLFIDDDIVPAPQLIQEHLKIHQSDDGRTVVLGPMLTPPAFQMLPWVQWEQAMLEKQYNSIVSGRWQPSARQFYTGNTSLARQHLLDHGGFDPSFRRAEDVELAYRLSGSGLRFQFNPQAIGYHYAERSFSSWLKIPYDYGRNDVRFYKDKDQKWLLPAIFHEFRWQRNPLIQLLTYVCLGHTALSTAVVSGLARIAQTGSKMNWRGITRFAYSGIFNLQYYQGVADQLGGRKEFFSGFRKYRSQ
ncbi:MAG: glycosyltransferase [Chloroflexi bacterium]|nr:glycosyltransferase [Chloroflexota bacterium]